LTCIDLAGIILRFRRESKGNPPSRRLGTSGRVVLGPRLYDTTRPQLIHRQKVTLGD
jgi:hypothetical protein